MPDLTHLRRSVVEVLDAWDGRGGMIGSAAALVTAEGLAWDDFRGKTYGASRKTPS